MAHQITLIPGDGIGPEITKATTRILEHSGGYILSDLASGLVGGLGMAPGANIGDDVAIFEAVHGSAPDIAGQKIANPSALILAAVMMLEYIDEPNAAKRIEQAVAKVIEKGIKVTKDINPNNFVGTAEFADAVIEEL